MEGLLKACKIGNEGEVARLLDADPALLERANWKGKRPLMVAASHGQLGVVKLLLERGSDVNTTDTHGKTALHWAAHKGHEEVVAFLLSRGAQANTITRRNTTSFMLACLEGRLSVARLLLQHVGGQALRETNEKGLTPLHYSARGGHEELVSFLLEQGAQANNRTIAGRTPLMEACSAGYLAVVRLFVKQGGQTLQETDEKGWTALHCAAQGGYEETVSFLLGQGAPANSRTLNGTTPFMKACSKGHVGVVRVLSQHMGAEAMQETDEKGWTALHLAAQGGYEELVSLLLGQGAQANSRTLAGITPLVIACGKAHLGVVRLLLQYVGAEALQETSEKGWTVLHFAAQGGYEEMVSFLLGQGAQASSRTLAGITPLVIACSKGHVGVVRVLLQHMGGEALQETNEKGWTALHCAVDGGHEELVALLLGQGAQAKYRTLGGNTPLVDACSKGHVGVVRLLLQHLGVQALQETNEQGFTALHYAAYGGHEVVVSFLLGQGAQTNSRDVYNRTPLMWACKQGHLAVVRVLVRHIGVQALPQRDRDGSTALHYAVEEGHEDVVRLLLVAGADPTIVNAGGRTPRTLAEEKGHTGCVAVFEWYEQWYECELERRAVLYRSTCLHKAYTTRRDMPTSQVPTYLQARVAAGRAVPRVVVSRQTERRATRSITRQAEASGKRKVEGEIGDAQGAAAGEEEERHAMLEYVVSALNEELVTELLEGFPCGK